jgi:uncharacterized OB-fold protein
MAKIVYVKCRHCGHEFIPRTEFPRQCGKCWRKWPLGKGGKQEGKTLGDVMEWLMQNEKEKK